MAGARKLQAEIDRTLKKVQEGVELFDEIWEKVYNAQNANQKEKFEAELKSQIKKLQRYRDDIKTWITNSDIKDKRPLTDARKQIETEMERFKVCEKEFKTKAFSKEGLSQAPKEDPKEKERNKVRKWISNALETISEQVNVYEAEIESSASNKKGKKGKDTSDKWQDLIDRCRFHEEKLEMVLRLIDNETLSPTDVEPVQDQLDYLLEQMKEANEDEINSIDDEAIYEELGLEDLLGPKEDEEEEVAPAPVPEMVKGKEAKLSAKEKKALAEKEKEEEKARQKKEKASTTETALPSINAAAMKAAPPKPGKELAPAKAPLTKMPVPVPAPAATARGKAQVSLTAQQPAVRGRTGQAEQQGLLARAGLAPPPAPPPAPALAAAAPLGSRTGKEDKAQPAGLPPPMSGRAHGHESFGAAGAGAAHLPSGLPPPAARAIAPATAAAALGGGPDAALPPPGKDEAGSGAVGGRNADVATEEHDSVRGLRSLVPGGGQSSGGGSRGHDAGTDGLGLQGDEGAEVSYDELGGMGCEAASQEDSVRALHLLIASLNTMPQASDSERPKTYVPRNPYPTPNSFPQTPAAVFDSPAVFEKFDTDTLFFIFYYQQGTYQQYLAARELKKQSWRYHKKYLTWFQRHEEPKVTADEYEQGTYVYFDYETGWCQRIKSEFTFEYGYLEDELQV